jgi:hypothetical protein
MTVRVGIIDNPLQPGEWVDHEVEDVCAFLKSHFGTWPATARIYDLEGVQTDRAAEAIGSGILANRDVTPLDEAGIERLQGLAGPLLVTVAPADPVTIIIAVVAVAVGLAAAFLLMPRVPDASNIYQSPNNSLSERTNRPRPNGRIPDIFGTVRSTPDLIAVPYKSFVNNVEVETALMCIGRGAYEVSDLRDGDTLLTSISGASAEVYAPNTSPNSGVPQLTVGDAIGDPVLAVRKMNEVNGQLLRPTNSNAVVADGNVRFVYPDTIESSGGVDFTTFFSVGDDLVVGGANFDGASGGVSVTATARAQYAGDHLHFDGSFDPSTVFAVGQYVTLSNAVFVQYDSIGNATYTANLNGTYQVSVVGVNYMAFVSPASVNPNWNTLDSFSGDVSGYQAITISRSATDIVGNLNGTYEVLAVTAGQITLASPNTVNAGWDHIDELPGGATAYISPSLTTSGERWIGPFVLDLDALDRFQANFVALSGLYRISDKGKQHANIVNVTVELTPVDSTDTPTGPPELFNTVLVGSDSNKESVGVTLTANPTFTGRCKVRARRTSPTDLDYEGTMVDEVKWRDGYGFASVDVPHFGNVTTVHSRTYATSGATSVKERKLNAKVRRKLPQRTGPSTFSVDLYGTDSVDAIFCAVALDPYIGNRPLAELDVPDIYATVDEVETYFGSTLAKEFGFTFDDDNVSFEETAITIAQTAFCRPYRQGSLIRLSFEQATDDSILLFNHRNTLPGSQRRTVTFGVTDNHDGVELEWTDPTDGALRTLLIPNDGSAVQPRKISMPAVRSEALAFWQAYRAWNKLVYQSVTLEQQCTQEAALVGPTDRVLITDQTRPPGMEGEVLGQDGLDVLLSQPVDLSVGSHTMFIQHVDGTVEALAVYPWVPPGGWEPGPGEYGADHWATLGTAPRLALAVDPALSIRAHYEIVAATDVRSRAYLVTEREPQSNFVETVRAVNYSPLYYAADQIVAWFPFDDGTLYDQSPWRRDGVVLSGAPAFVEDATRGKLVYSAAAAGVLIDQVDFDSPDAYTKAAWVYRTANLLSYLTNAPEVGEAFGFDATGHLFMTHGVTSLVGPVVPLNQWHHVVVSYDGNAARHTRLYVDGAQVAASDLIGRAGVWPNKLLRDFRGRVDDLRWWKRGFSAVDVAALYRSTRSHA